ncbi:MULTISPECIES: 3'-5' exonuclease [Gammaproteobacteria]|uniref:3'-5' exonuclease n=1 Tax=Gammaproteobacteria TaxID=1236 RepID=UPI000DCFDA08|nr:MULTISPECIES: 3'-5' exonuclease [Gammaproteobacteria]RTE86105.1 3'-5' exonuclease [Aliidiomarina sp. B3213]TCZ91458.1 3'-5' exonuclease [Lysobacter sp. N42]
MYLGQRELKSALQSQINWPARLQELAGSARNSHLQHFYSATIPNADTPLRDVKFLALDFETSGLDPQQHGIVSVGVVPLTLERVFANKGKHWLAKPRKAMADESVVYHGITHSQIEDAPDLLETFDELLEVMSGHIMIVHYKAIERTFLDVALRERIGEGIEFPVIDTMEIEHGLHRANKTSFWQRLKKQPPMSIRLADSRARYGLPFYRPHNALTDALATAELFQAQVQHHYSPDTPLSELWS